MLFHFSFLCLTMIKTKISTFSCKFWWFFCPVLNEFMEFSIKTHFDILSLILYFCILRSKSFNLFQKETYTSILSQKFLNIWSSKYWHSIIVPNYMSKVFFCKLHDTINTDKKFFKTCMILWSNINRLKFGYSEKDTKIWPIFHFLLDITS